MNLLLILQLSWNPKLEQGFAFSLLQKALVLLAQYFNTFLLHMFAVFSFSNKQKHANDKLILSYLLSLLKRIRDWKIKAADFKKPLHNIALQWFCGLWDWANTMLCT